MTSKRYNLIQLADFLAAQAHSPDVLSDFLYRNLIPKAIMDIRGKIMHIRRDGDGFMITAD